MLLVVQRANCLSVSAAVVAAALLSSYAESSAEVVEQALGAIRSLSFDNAANIRALSEANACVGRPEFAIFRFLCFHVDI